MWARLGEAGFGLRTAKGAGEASGSVLVEFAASAILLFTLVFGIVECSRAVYVYHFLANVSQEAARYAMVRGDSWNSACGSVVASNCTATSSNVTAFVQSLTPAGVTAANLQVTTTWGGTTPTGANCLVPPASATNSVGCVVAVAVSYPFSFVSPLLPRNTLNFSSTSEVVIAQ